MTDSKQLDLDTLKAVEDMVNAIPYYQYAAAAYKIAIIDVLNGIGAMMNRCEVPFGEGEDGKGSK